MANPEGKLVTPVGFDINGYPKAGNVPFGYAEPFVVHAEDTNAAAGTNELLLDTVPPAEVWVLTGLSAHDASSVADRVGLYLYDGTTYHYLKIGDPSAANVTVDWEGWVLVPEDWEIRAVLTGVTAGDGIYANAFGFEMTE